MDEIEKHNPQNIKAIISYANEVGFPIDIKIVSHKEADPSLDELRKNDNGEFIVDLTSLQNGTYGACFLLVKRVNGVFFISSFTHIVRVDDFRDDTANMSKNFNIFASSLKDDKVMLKAYLTAERGINSFSTATTVLLPPSDLSQFKNYYELFNAKVYVIGDAGVIRILSSLINNLLRFKQSSIDVKSKDSLLNAINTEN